MPRKRDESDESNFSSEDGADAIEASPGQDPVDPGIHNNENNGGDADGCACILSELSLGIEDLRAFSAKLTEHYDDYDVALKHFDPNGSGCIDLHMFIKCVSKLGIEKEKAIEVFNVLLGDSLAQLQGASAQTEQTIGENTFKLIWDESVSPLESDGEFVTRFATAMKCQLPAMQSLDEKMDNDDPTSRSNITAASLKSDRRRWTDGDGAQSAARIATLEAELAKYQARAQELEARLLEETVPMTMPVDETTRGSLNDSSSPSPSNPTLTFIVPDSPHDASLLSSRSNSEDGPKHNDMARLDNMVRTQSANSSRKPLTIARAPTDHSAALKEKRMAKARAKFPSRPKLAIKDGKVKYVNNGGYRKQLDSVRQKIRDAAYKVDGVDWNELFDGLKKDDAGSIELYEVRTTLRRVLKIKSKDITDYDLRTFFQALDINGTGRLSSDKVLDFLFSVMPERKREGGLKREPSPKEKDKIQEDRSELESSTTTAVKKMPFDAQINKITSLKAKDRMLALPKALSDKDGTMSPKDEVPKLPTHGTGKDLVLMRRLHRTYCLQKIADWRATHIPTPCPQLQSKLCKVFIRVRPLRAIERQHGEFEVVTVLSRGGVGLHQCLPGTSSKQISMIDAVKHLEFFYPQAHGPDYSAETKEQKIRDFFELCDIQRTREIFAHDIADICQADPRRFELFRLPVESNIRSMLQTLGDFGIESKSPIMWAEFRSFVAKLHKNDLERKLLDLFSRCDASETNTIKKSDAIRLLTSNKESLEADSLWSGTKDTEISDVLNQIETVADDQLLSWEEFRDMFIPTRRYSPILPDAPQGSGTESLQHRDSTSTPTSREGPPTPHTDLADSTPFPLPEVPSAETFVQACACPLFEQLMAGNVATLFVFGHTHSGKNQSMLDVIDFMADLIFQHVDGDAGRTASDHSEAPNVILRAFKLNADSCLDLLATNDDQASLTLQYNGDARLKVLAASESHVDSKRNFLRTLRIAIHKFSTPPAGTADPLCRSSSDSALVCSLSLPQSGGSVVLAYCAAPRSTERDASIDALRIRLGKVGQQQVASPMLQKSNQSFQGSAITEDEKEIATARRLMGVLYDSFERPGSYVAALGCVSPSAMDTDRSLLSLSALQTLTMEVHKKAVEEEVLKNTSQAKERIEVQSDKKDTRNPSRAFGRRADPTRRGMRSDTYRSNTSAV